MQKTKTQKHQLTKPNLTNSSATSNNHYQNQTTTSKSLQPLLVKKQVVSKTRIQPVQNAEEPNNKDRTPNQRTPSNQRLSIPVGKGDIGFRLRRTLTVKIIATRVTPPRMQVAASRGWAMRHSTPMRDRRRFSMKSMWRQPKRELVEVRRRNLMWNWTQGCRWSWVKMGVLRIEVRQVRWS